MDSDIPHLSQEAKNHLKKFFLAFDKDGNGRVDPHELKEALKAAGYHFSPLVVNRMIKLVNHSAPFGSVSFEEFCNLSSYLEVTKKAFDQADRNKNGEIDTNELGEALADTGYTLSGPQLKKLLKLVDINESGGIQYEEWVSLTFYLKLIAILFKRNKETESDNLVELLHNLGIKVSSSKLHKDLSLDEFIDLIYDAEMKKF